MLFRDVDGRSLLSSGGDGRIELEDDAAGLPGDLMASVVGPGGSRSGFVPKPWPGTSAAEGDFDGLVYDSSLVAQWSSCCP